MISDIEKAMKKFERQLQETWNSQNQVDSRNTAGGKDPATSTLSRQKRTDVFSYYLIRNVITFVQILLVFARKIIVVGSFFYNKMNVPEDLDIIE